MTSMDLDDAMNTCSVYFTEEKEESYEAKATHSHWVNYTSQNGGPSENFAEFTEGNDVEAFLGGKAYFSALLDAFESAQKTIYITGWQVNWDAQLAKGIRLVDALLKQVEAKPQLKVYIMPWDCMVIKTYAPATERVFAALNQYLGREVFYVQLAGEQSGKFFSHHQKCVVIDESVAFIGGIDLAYGRYDDGEFNLKADAEGRKGLNQYNACIGGFPLSGQTWFDPMRKQPVSQRNNTTPSDIDQAEREAADSIIKHVLDPEKKYWQASADNTCLDPLLQPRQPWQDYQVKIVGPAVNDLVRNFVLRWNSFDVNKKNDNKLQTSCPRLTFIPFSQPENGHCQIQVLRSASLEMRKAEFKYSSKELRPKSAPTMLQDDILRGMHALISKAEHYIYIENQFFISAFGSPSTGVDDDLSPIANSIDKPLIEWATRKMPGDQWALPRNQIVEWLSDKIKWTILGYKPQPFHIYIVLPVHPEGKLNDGTIVAQIHQTRQSLVFGSESLMNRIRRTLWVKNQLEKQSISRAEWCAKIPEIENECGDGYTSIDFVECEKYITLLNLRNHDDIGGKPVTEQIYVHSKLMIVDDRYVLVGSANINERSLLGDHDSELAVLISDMENGIVDIDGTKKLVPYRNFARSLRIAACQKLLGPTVSNEILNEPAAEKTWQAIREQALTNTNAYEAVFNFIPRNYSADTTVSSGKNDSISNLNKVNATRPGASLWPVWDGVDNDNDIKDAASKMPFSTGFWTSYHGELANSNKLKEIKGYITLLPLHWTENENNLIPYHADLIAYRQVDDSSLQTANEENNEQSGEGTV
ncbi:phospholipase [Salmonella enterica]|nr:phospholipase [Salmonella enterica]